MIIIILATLLLAGITVLNFLSHPKKILIMSGLAALLVFMNFINELSFHWADSSPHWRKSDTRKLIVPIHNLYDSLDTRNPQLIRD